MAKAPIQGMRLGGVVAMWRPRAIFSWFGQFTLTPAGSLRHTDKR